MALIYTEGFDYYSTAAPTDNTTGMHLGKRYLLNSTSATITSAYLTLVAGIEGRGNCLRSTNTLSADNKITYAISNSTTTPMTQLCFGMYFQANAANSSVIRFQNTGTTQSYIELIANVNSNLSIISTSDTVNSTLVGTPAATTFVFNNWYHIEVMINITGTTASVQVYQDNVQIINISSLNWYGAGNGNMGIEQFVLGKTAYGLLISRIQYFDHLYMTTGERLGPTEIRPLLPSADTTQKQWTPSTGTANYAMVNETAITTSSPGMTTQLSATTAGLKDYYNVNGMLSKDQGCTFSGIQQYYFAKGSVVGTETVNSKILIGSFEDGAGTQIAPTNTNTILYRRNVVTTNPSTSAPWTYSDLTSIQLGIERTA